MSSQRENAGFPMGTSTHEIQPGDVENALYTCKTVSEMIDLATRALEQIRDLATGESYFKDEIIETEAKIMRLFAKQISVKRKLFRCRSLAIPVEIRDYPSLSQFFRVLGFPQLVADRCKQARRTNDLVLGSASLRYAEEEDALTLELLMNTSECEIRDRFASRFADLLAYEQVGTLLIALGCLRAAVQLVESGGAQSHAGDHSVVPSTSSDNVSLNWSYRDVPSSVEPCCLRGHGENATNSSEPATSRCNVRASLGTSSNGTPHEGSHPAATSSASVPLTLGLSVNNKSETKFTPPASPRGVVHLSTSPTLPPPLAPTTPPMLTPAPTPTPAALFKRKTRILLHLQAGFPLIKSKSQESQLGVRVQPAVNHAVRGEADAEMTQHMVYPTMRHARPKPVNLKLSGSHETLNASSTLPDANGDVEPGYADGDTAPLSATPFLWHQHSVGVHMRSATVGNALQDDAVSIASGHSVGGLSLQVPKSPVYYPAACASHRFESAKLTLSGTCDVCRKRLLLTKTHVCTACRFKCHRDCVHKAQQYTTCPGEAESSSANSSPRRVNRSRLGDVTGTAQRHAGWRPVSVSTSSHSQVDEPAVLPLPGSSTTSSAQSTAPSSPIADGASMPHATTSSSSAANLSAASAQPSPFIIERFQFPPPAEDAGNRATVTISPAGVNIPAVTVTDVQSPPSDAKSKRLAVCGSPSETQQPLIIGTTVSSEGDRTLIDSGWSDIDKLSPLRADSIDFDLPDDVPTYSTDGTLLSPSGEQNSLSRTVSISATLKEWDIPFESLQRKQLIGVGRFATVHRGHWHGDCAVKLFAMTEAHGEAEMQLQTFKLEVAVLKKTRHDNLVLFMGACMKPPNLAIVTSLCRGPEHTLFHKIHVLKDKLPLNRATLIASQITQGMSYLHAKRVLHKDLRTKNVFIEGAKIVIADYGLFNVTRFCTARTQLLTASCLYYLAPEIVRSIALSESGALHFLPPTSHTYVHSESKDYDPFTTQSDVFAFGTIWYELLVADWPFREQTADSVLWRMANGGKPEISELQCNKESKALFLACWSHDAARRPSFTSIYQALERIPKKGLARAPSHPVTRSAEAFY